MTAFLVAEAHRLATRCEEELRSFSLGEGTSPDW
jgi:hypothetical protein